MPNPHRCTLALALALGLSLQATRASADEVSDLATAKASFTRGLELAREQKWGEALDAFETAGRAKRHALTTYNAAIAERALSRYTRARLRFAAALEEDAAAGGSQLAEHYKNDTKTFLAELDTLLVHVDVSLEPADASLAIDGRPLSWTSDDRRVAYAGVAAANAGERVDRTSFEVIADPGAHVFTVTKDGFETVASKETLRSGARAQVKLSLTAMPGKLRIDANQGRSIVRIDEIDVGLAPVLLERPAGTYRVDVRKPGFVTYNTRVSLRPGQQTELFARMNEDTPLTKRWWFWTAAGGILVAAAATVWLGVVYFSEPNYSGGTADWVARPR